MQRERELKCECGGKFIKREKIINKIYTGVMICDRCGHKSFTEKQVKNYIKLALLVKPLSITRKVMRVGNSIGVTLPAGFVKVGQKATFFYLGKGHLRVTFR